jgi:hypothetical protein
MVVLSVAAFPAVGVVGEDPHGALPPNVLMDEEARPGVLHHFVLDPPHAGFFESESGEGDAGFEGGLEDRLHDAVDPRLVEGAEDFGGGVSATEQFVGVGFKPVHDSEQASNRGTPSGRCAAPDLDLPPNSG